jgi:hypothetical protein
MDGEIRETVEIKHILPPICFSLVDAVEVIRSSVGIIDLHIFRKPLPRNGAYDSFLQCPECHRLRRSLYGWSAGYSWRKTPTSTVLSF